MGVATANRRPLIALRVIAIRRVWIAALLIVVVAPARAATVLHELHDSSFGQLDELIGTARALAAADDTYEFVSRPNIPYVSAHYAPEQLAANRIDTVLIINCHHKPLFWRRVNHGLNRGFPDARAFLAELPVLPAPGAAGTPGIVTAALLAHGPALVVALPIYRANGTGSARGW